MLEIIVSILKAAASLGFAIAAMLSSINNYTKSKIKCKSCRRTKRKGETS